MPWGRNPLRDTKDKGTNSSSGSSGANWAKAEVFNLPLLLLLKHLLLDTVGQRTLDTCTACWTLPTHTHTFPGQGEILAWHSCDSTISYSLQRQHFLSCRTGAPLSAWSCRHRDIPSTAIYAQGASAASFTLQPFTCFHANVQSYHPHLTSELYLEK